VPLALAAAAALGAAGPVAGQMHGGPETPAAPGARTVSIGDRGYGPSVVVVAPGTRVAWRNDGTRRHTVTATDGAFDSGALGPGEVFVSTAPAATGTVAYACDFHAYMRGTLVVSALSLEAPALVAAGGRAHLGGQAPGMAAGTAVVVEARTGGAWVPAAAATVDATGAFAAHTAPLAARAVLRARIGDDVSPAVRVGVVPRVGAARAGRSLRVAVTPARAGGFVLERLDLDTYAWHAVRRVPLRAGRARVAVPGPGVYRASVRSPGAGLSPAGSRAVAFR
jgi:plastocyanin